MPRIDAFALGKQGLRAAMEDRHALSVEGDTAWGAVFDGHRGDEVAEYAARTLPSLSHLGAADALRSLEVGARPLPAGACAVVFRLDGPDLQVANLGDAEVVVVDGDGAVAVTEMHRVTNLRERQRVLDAGAVIDGPYVMDMTTGNGLMPTRSLGDDEFARVGISGDVAEWRGRLDGDGWVVAACDGLWDVLRPEELPAFLEGTAEEVARRLMDEALEVRHSRDNVTVLVLHRTP